LKTKYQAVRSQVFDFLGIGSYDAIPALIYEEHVRRKGVGKARRLLGNMFGLENDNTIIEHHLREYARTANDVKRFVRHLTKSAVRADSFMTLEDIQIP